MTTAILYEPGKLPELFAAVMVKDGKIEPKEISLRKMYDVACHMRTTFAIPGGDAWSNFLNETCVILDPGETHSFATFEEQVGKEIATMKDDSTHVEQVLAEGDKDVLEFLGMVADECPAKDPVDEKETH